MASILNFSSTTPAAPTGEALGTWQVDAATPRNTSVIITPMVGATASPSVNGVGGGVPRPLGADAAAGKFLRADGTWALPSGSGTVTSVGLTAPAFLNVSGSPVTGSGTLALALANQSANVVFAGPSSGGVATPTFRALVLADLPSGMVQKYTSSWSSQTSVTVTHGLGSANVIVQVFDGSGNVVQPQTLQVTSTQIILTFGVSFSGSLVAIG